MVLMKDDDSLRFIDQVYCRQHNANNDRKIKRSYGIICIILDKMKVIMTENIPYPRPPAKENNIELNFNELYNLQMSSFPDGGLTERQYTFPKGRIDNLDYNKKREFTKVREFIEETKYYSPALLELANQHFKDQNFVSVLNNVENQVYEEWIGLDDKRYSVEYAIFIINSLSELKYIAQNKKNTISPSLITTAIPYCYADAKAIKNYHGKMKLTQANDSSTRTKFVDIKIALRYNNVDKKLAICSIDEQKIEEAILKRVNEEEEKKK